MNDIMKTNEGKAPEKIQSVQPACSICEEDGKVRLRVEMPGVAKDGIEVGLEKNELTIVGKAGADEPRGTYLLRERPRGEFRKRFIIDDSIDRDKIEAVMADGILTLTLARKEAAKPRKIVIA